MLSRTARPLTLATTATLSAPAPTGQVLHRERVVVHRDPLPDLAPVETAPGFGACVPRSADLVCAENASCICPLSDHVTDAERAVMNDISRQASRLATVLAWIFALAALTALVLLMLR